MWCDQDEMFHFIFSRIPSLNSKQSKHSYSYIARLQAQHSLLSNVVDRMRKRLRYSFSYFIFKSSGKLQEVFHAD